MMTKLLAIIAVLGLLSCTKKEPIAPTDVPASPSKQEASVATPTSGLCPSGIGASAGDKPKLEVMTSGDVKLIVCGYSTESEFDVYSIDRKGKVSQPIVTYGALDHLKTYSGNKELILDELAEYKNDWIPVFRRKITCDAARCELSSPVCIYQKPSANGGDLSEIRSYLNGQNKNKVPDERIVQRAFEQSLAGNKEAQDLFLASRETLKLDGASAEVFSRSAELLKRLKAANCL